MHPWAFYLTVFGLLIGTAGTTLTALSLQSRVTVSLGEPLDPKNVYSFPFVISNDSLLSVEKVAAVSYFRHIEDTHQNTVDTGDDDLVLKPQELRPGEKRTVHMGQLLASSYPFVTFDMALIVSYSPPFLPFVHNLQAFHFVAVRQSDGNLRLEQQPAQGIEDEYREKVKEYGWKDSIAQ